MIPLNNDLMRATRRFDAAGRPMTRDIAHALEHATRAPRRARPVLRLPSLPRFGGDAVATLPGLGVLRAPVAVVGALLGGLWR
ncbi:MAG: hypothetical protein ACE368_06685 [Paracoccaceae bacterium]